MRGGVIFSLWPTKPFYWMVGRCKNPFDFLWVAILAFHLIAISYAYKVNAATVERSTDDTLLMFVGEDLQVLSIASRREESAQQAPAIARVVNRKQIIERGYASLGEILADLPGFHIAQKEWGDQPYLRGIPNSVLFLYDTVPIGSDISKSLPVLGHEVSLAAIKRIEVITGPGSTLWGPDAFGGIVNVAPLTGKDFSGVETGVLYGAPGDKRGAYANLGMNQGEWDAFMSFSGRDGEEENRSATVVRFFGDRKKPVSVGERFGLLGSDDSRYIEASGALNLQNWFSVSGRITDLQKPYTLADTAVDLPWREEQETTGGYIKCEAKKAIGELSALRGAGYYSFLSPSRTVIDRSIDQKEKTAYGEVLWDQSLPSGKGLLTGGVSFREKRISHAPVWEDYFPDFLVAENEDFLPGLSEKNYNTRLWSLFAQYSHKIKTVDFSAGLRFDEHDSYHDHVSFNASAVWAPVDEWRAKILYGTAYRTPFARQLLADQTPDLEMITSYNAQLSYRPSNVFEASICCFFSRIDHHYMEDLYAGLSEPNEQDIRGIEAELHISPIKQVEISVNATFIDNVGAAGLFRYNDFDFIRPDGTIEEHYVDFSIPYDIGPELLGNMMVVWKPFEHLTLFGRLRYTGAYSYQFPRGESLLKSSEQWRIDSTMMVSPLQWPDVSLIVAIKNLFDREGKVPGTYSLIDREPITFEVQLRKKW